MIPYQLVFQGEKSDITIIMCSYCSKRFETVQQHEQHRCRKESSCRAECLSCKNPYCDHKVSKNGCSLEKDAETCSDETQSGGEGKSNPTLEVSNTNSPNYRCCICNKDVPNIPYLIRHIKYHMSRKTEVVQPEQCSHCRKVFTNKQQLARHEATHKDVRPFKCEKCDKVFKSADSVKRHMYVHSDTKPFSCPICNKQFKAKHLMKKHEETHSDVKNYECPKCGKKFKARNSLRDHLLVHNGTRPYKCDECDQAFYRRSHLATHKTIHSEVKPFMCQVCEKCFGRREHLKVHERIHNGEKPFKCNQCDRSFNQQAGLQAHLVSHSDKRPFTCLKCKKSFKYPSQIKHHACRPDEVIGPCNGLPLNTADTTSTSQESGESTQTTPSTVDIANVTRAPTFEPENTIILIQIDKTPSGSESAMSVNIVTTHQNNTQLHDTTASTADVGLEGRKDAPNIEVVSNFIPGNTQAVSEHISETAQTATNTQTTLNSETSFFSSLNTMETQAGRKHVVEPQNNLRNVDFQHVTVTERCTQARYVTNTNTLTSYSSRHESVTSTHQHNAISGRADAAISDIVTGTEPHACIGVSHEITVGAQSNNLPAQRANAVWSHGEVTNVVRNYR